MYVLRFLLKILLSPVMLILQLIEWIGIFLLSFGGTILYIISGIIFLIAAASCILQTASGTEVLKMFIISFTMYLITRLGEWFVGKVLMLRLWIGNCLHN